MEKETLQQKVNIYCIVQDVIRELWVALLIGISAALLAAVGAKLMYQPTYTSQTTFVVTAKENMNGAYGNMSKAQKMAEVFSSVLDSNVLKKRVCEEMELNSFPGTVDIALVPETNLLTVSVTADSPGTAFEVLSTMLDCYPEVGKNVLGEVVMEVFDEPQYPIVPDQSFNEKEIMKKAFLLGIIIMLGIVAIFSYMKDTVKSESDIPLKLEAASFAVLYHESRYKNIKDFLKRRKKKLFVTEAATSFGYVETMKKIRTKLLYQMKRSNAKVVLITSARTGEGKTTVTVNLAQTLAQRSKKVLLIEGDLRSPGLARAMQINDMDYPDWGSQFAAGKELESAIVEPEGWSFHVMVNNTRIGRSTELLASTKMRRFIARMKNQYDVILIDAPHAWKRSDTEVLARLSDISLLVVKQNMVAAKYINDTIDMLNNYGQGLLGCIFNDVFSSAEIFTSGYGYGYYGYGYGKYGRYNRYNQYYGAYRKMLKKESEHE